MVLSLQLGDLNRVTSGVAMQTQVRYDVVIVGAGVAGAMLAWKLSKERPQASILLLDAGDNPLDCATRKRFVETYALGTDRGVLSPYRRLEGNKFAPSPEGGIDKKHFVQSGPDAYKSNYVRMVGGSTWAWRGNCPRWVPADFQLKTKYGVGEDWPIEYKEIEPYFCDAEDELGVSADHAEQDGLQGAFRSRPYPMPKIAQAFGDKIIKSRVDGASIEGKAIHVVATPQARNSQEYQGRKACQGNANCIPICPSGAKYDASVHINKALANGVKHQWHSVVTRLEVDGNGAIKAVYFRDWRIPGNPEQSVAGKLVVLATHAIETPRLWLQSKLDNSRDLVGRFLMDHLAGEVTGYMEQPIFPFRGPQNTSSILDFRDGDFRRTHAAFNMTIGNDGWGRKLHPFAALDKAVWDSKKLQVKLFGAELQAALATGKDAITKMIRLSYSTEQLPEPENRVTLADEKDAIGLARPKIAYRLSDYSIRSLEFGHKVATQILEKAGVRVDHTPEPNPSYNGAGHPMGTCRMGRSATKSVVDPFGQSHAHPNLYVVGSSVFVTGSSVNPTLLLAALTLRTADAIAKRL